MEKLKELKEGEAEIFVRTKKKILKLELPVDLVKELEEMKDDLKADDILEVLVKSAKSMMNTLNSLKKGDYEHKDEKGKNNKN